MEGVGYTLGKDNFNTYDQDYYLECVNYFLKSRVKDEYSNRELCKI